MPVVLELRRLSLAFVVLTLAASNAFGQSSLRLAWTASTDATVTGYRVSYALQSGGTTRTVDVGNVTTATISGLTLGQWYNFTVAAYTRAGSVSVPSPAVAAFTTSVGSLTASRSGTIPPGTSVTWTASPPAGSPSLEYEFWIFSNGAWSIARAWSSQATYTWTPQMADVGQHAVQVWARQPGATSSYEAYAGTNLFDVAMAPFTIAALVPSAASPFVSGQAIQWEAIVQPQNLTNALEYQFWLLNKATGTWTSIRPYGAGNVFTWTPSWDQAGNFAIQVWARYPGTTVNYSGWSGSDFRVNRGVGTLTADKVFPVPPGTPVTWTANAGSSSSTLQYRFWLFRNGAWQMVRDYSTTTTFTWTPTSTDIGTDLLQVWVRSGSSTANYDAWKGTPYFDVSRTAPSVITINFSTPPQRGTATTISAVASGGYNGPLQYRFWVFSNATNAWTMIRDYSSSSTASWTPSASGTYGVQVWVRSAGATSNYESWLSSGPVVVP